MMKPSEHPCATGVVEVLHNLSRDASFGLNAVFAGGKRFEPRSHALVKVFQFSAEEWPGARYPESIYHVLNVGHEPGYAHGDARKLAEAYRARRLRSLSVGDVLVINGFYFAVARLGFECIDGEEDLHIVDAETAERLIRERFEFKPGEQLTLSVPWDAAHAASQPPPFRGNSEWRDAKN